MAKAIITAPQGFRCAPDGHTVRLFPAGAPVDGQVAEWAVAAGAAKREAFDPRTETKTAPKRRGRPRK